MVAGPEIARVISEFEDGNAKADQYSHHEQQSHVQATFAQQVQSLVRVFENLGNPFAEDGDDLIALGTRDIDTRQL